MNETKKPTYIEIVKELEEYKTLLWELSDEYKLNVGNAEKKVEELEARCKELEEQLSQKSEIETINEEEIDKQKITDLSFISNLGIAACIIDKNGKIIDINNKFKFFVEFLSFDIENLTNIKQLLEKADNKSLLTEYKLFKNSDEAIFQSLLTAKNSFNRTINAVVKLSNNYEHNNYTALFIELNKFTNLHIVKGQEAVNKSIEEDDCDKASNDNDCTIEVFAEKYEVYKKLLKVFGSKKRKKPEVLPDNMYFGFVRSFNLEQERHGILKNLNNKYFDFSENLKKTFPRLTHNEEKHCMLIKAGLSYKEIAAIMNISVNGVKIARNRLRKKLRIDNMTTGDFINSI